MPIVFGKDGLTGQTAQQAFGRGNWMAKKERPAIDWLRYEKEALTQGYTAVCGIDEAGRGPLAGPVYAAAVILPPGVMIDGVNDSKKLSAKKREALFDVICEQAAAYAITCAEVSEIEQLNILQATFLAMRRAVAELSAAADFAIVDGNRLPGLSIPTRAVVSGDASSASVAAASVLAKVSRDRYMLQMDALYPQYGFAQHKGYGTALHVERLREFGPSPIHRMSFLKKILP